MKYYFLRLLLPDVDEVDGTLRLFEKTNRDEYLKQLFGERIDFSHAGSEFAYVPTEQIDFDNGKIMIGKIGKKKTETENLPPDKNLDETEHTGWHATYILVDTRDFSDGQKIAFQYNRDVGQPLPIMKNFIKCLNDENKGSGWNIEVRLITHPVTFWEAVKENEGKITSVTFSFTTPNILRLKNSLTEELGRNRIERNASEVAMTIKNAEGNLKISKEDKETNDAVEYISEGGGEAQIKSGVNKVFDSSEEGKIQEKEIEDEKRENEDEASRWKRIVKQLFNRR